MMAGCQQRLEGMQVVNLSNATVQYWLYPGFSFETERPSLEKSLKPEPAPTPLAWLK